MKTITLLVVSVWAETSGRPSRYHLPQVRAAQKHFGSWGKALYAAGIDPNLYYVRHKWREPRVTHKRSSRLWQPT